MFNGAVATRNPTSSPGRYAGMDNGWSISLLDLVLTEFNKSIVQYPNIKRFPGGASTDMLPNLQNPENPLPYDPAGSARVARMQRSWRSAIRVLPFRQLVQAAPSLPSKPIWTLARRASWISCSW